METNNKPKHQHDFVQTGMRRSWCRKCNHEAEWDAVLMEFKPLHGKMICYEPESEQYIGYFSGNPYIYIERRY